MTKDDVCKGINDLCRPGSDSGDITYRHDIIRKQTGVLAKIYFANCPSGHHLDLAIDRLKEAAMWAIASIPLDEG